MTYLNQGLDPSTLKLLQENDKTAQRVLGKNISLRKGQRIGVRLNLNILKSTGVAIQTLHGRRPRGKVSTPLYRGPVLGYASTVHLKHVTFQVDQNGRAAIAQHQQHKFPMASVDGCLEKLEMSPPPQDQLTEWTEIRFNPMQSHLFVNQNNEAVAFAEKVIIFGHRVWGQGVVYHNLETAPTPKDNLPSIAKIKKTIPALGI